MHCIYNYIYILIKLNYIALYQYIYTILYDIISYEINSYNIIVYIYNMYILLIIIILIIIILILIMIIIIIYIYQIHHIFQPKPLQPSQGLRLLQRHVRQRSQERHGGCVAVGHVQRQPAAIVPGRWTENGDFNIDI